MKKKQQTTQQYFTNDELNLLLVLVELGYDELVIQNEKHRLIHGIYDEDISNRRIDTHNILMKIYDLKKGV